MEPVSATGKLSLSRRWLSFAILFFICVGTGFNMMKAPPIFPILITELGFTEASIGWMMTAFTATCIILALPANMLLQSLGVKRVFILLGACTVIGDLVGALAGSMTLMLVGRFIEGVGVGLALVAGPAAANILLPAKVRGLAMAIFTLWFPIGAVAANIIVPMMESALGWRFVWVLSAALIVLGLVLLLFLYAQPDEEPAPDAVETTEVSNAGVVRKTDWRSIVAMALVYLFFNLIWSGVVTSFYPTYLQLGVGTNAQTAGMVTAIPNAIVIVLCPLVGALSDRIGTRKWISAIGMLLVTPVMLISFTGSFNLSILFMVLLSIVAGSVPTGIYALIPVAAANQKVVGLGMGIVSLCGNLGLAVGAATFGAVATTLGWQTASFVYLVPVAFAGFLVCLLAREQRQRRRP